MKNKYLGFVVRNRKIIRVEHFDDYDSALTWLRALPPWFLTLSLKQKDALTRYIKPRDPNTHYRVA